MGHRAHGRERHPRIIPQRFSEPPRSPIPAEVTFRSLEVKIRLGGWSSATFRWMGTDWKQLTPTSSPEPRAFPSLALDHDRNIVVMFGGLSSQNADNTWTWNGTTWTLQNPVNQPPFTYFSAAAYDRTLKQVVIFGGLANGFNHDITWGWDSADWQDLAPPTAPSPRSKMALALDTALNRVILFGGTPGIGQFLGDTWELEP